MKTGIIIAIVLIVVGSVLFYLKKKETTAPAGTSTGSGSGANAYTLPAGWKAYPGMDTTGSWGTTNPKAGMTIAQMVAMAEHNGYDAFFVPDDSVTSENPFTHESVTLPNPRGNNVEFKSKDTPVAGARGVLYMKG